MFIFNLNEVKKVDAIEIDKEISFVNCNQVFPSILAILPLLYKLNVKLMLKCM